MRNKYNDAASSLFDPKAKSHCGPSTPCSLAPCLHVLRWCLTSSVDVSAVFARYAKTQFVVATKPKTKHSAAVVGKSQTNMKSRAGQALNMRKRSRDLLSEREKSETDDDQITHKQVDGDVSFQMTGRLPNWGRFLRFQL